MTVDLPDKSCILFDCALDYYKGVLATLKLRSEQNRSIIVGYAEDLQRYGYIGLNDVLSVVGLAIFWTLLRYLSNAFAVPLVKSLGASEKNVAKFPESFFKFWFYCFMWGYACYVVIFSEKIFQQKYQVWAEYSPTKPVPVGSYNVYLLQCSFYLHSIYGTLFMDYKRKDTAVMLFHHFLTLTLIGFSYSLKFVKIGCLLIFLHDLSDAFLEFAKMNIYLKQRNGKVYMFHEYLVNFGFAGFGGTWLVNRLYLFLHKIMMGGMYAPFVSASPEFRPLPLHEFFAILLLILYGLNCYWFFLVCGLLVRMFRGDVKGVDDIREKDVDDKWKKISEQRKIIDHNENPRPDKDKKSD